MKAREKWGLLMLKNWDQENFYIIILLEFNESVRHDNSKQDTLFCLFSIRK